MVLLETHYQVNATDEHMKEIISNHIVVSDRDILSDQPSLNSEKNSDVSGFTNNSSYRTSIKFGCKKQVPLYSLKKNSNILPQNTESPFKITVHPVTVKPGDEVKGK